jgi:hypothetical protein
VESPTAFPLQWPQGWPRAKYRTHATFSQKAWNGTGTYKVSKAVTVATARDRLSGELERLGARYVVLSTNMELRLDGQPRSDRSDPADPGVAVYFQLSGKQIALACDKWDRVADNIVALAKHIEAMRGMDRWGVGTAAQAFAGYEALPAPDPWWQTLGLKGPNVTRSDIIIAYRKASQGAHPDRPGGSHDKMAAINAARDAGLQRFESADA